MTEYTTIWDASQMRMDTVIPSDSGLVEYINAQRVEDKVDFLLKLASIGFSYQERQNTSTVRTSSLSSTRPSVMPSARKKPVKIIPVSLYWEPRLAKQLINKYS